MKRIDMAVNNFKKLEKEQIKRFDKNTDRVGKNIQTNINNFKFVGSLLELYITTAINFLLGFTNLDEETKDSDSPSRYPNN